MYDSGDKKIYRRVVNEFTAVIGVAVGCRGAKDQSRGASFTIMLTATGNVLSVFVPDSTSSGGLPNFSDGRNGIQSIEKKGMNLDMVKAFNPQ